MPFVDEMVGELVAHHWHGTPQIDLEVKPPESQQYAKVGFNLREARQAAAELLQLVDIAQQAMWTPVLLADVREHYLPGATDAEIIERLTRLAERDAGLELRFVRPVVPAGWPGAHGGDPPRTRRPRRRSNVGRARLAHGDAVSDW
ncbi:hypothetical protein [Jiangella endophytica]|uniref:hypothetical protein n=1 Tax=Jiangella endophytica TaxID=1623398 RepID=UPI0013005778|nr:hypothetical protein [Jiangella endophytica]